MRTALSALLLLVACRGDVPVKPPQGVLAVKPAKLDFGTATVGVPVALTITLTNSGNESLTLNDFAFTGDHASLFTIEKPSTSDLSAHGLLALTVTYAPTAAGDHHARLLVITDADNGPEVVIPLTGHAAALGP